MARTTPLADSGIWLKREDEHELGAFKWRGALAVLEEKRPDLVVTASTGNHGAATAWAARRTGARAVVFVPERASAAKVALIEKQGAELRHLGADLDEAKAAARAYADESGAFFFEDGAEPAQFAGYEAIGDELLDDVPEPASVVVPVGNGALAIGVFRAVARRAPNETGSPFRQRRRLRCGRAGGPAALSIPTDRRPSPTASPCGSRSLSRSRS
jgi:threonine dehydratase